MPAEHEIERIDACAIEQCIGIARCGIVLRDFILSVAAVNHIGVVAGSAFERIVPEAADERVVARAAIERVGSGVAGENVILSIARPRQSPVPVKVIFSTLAPRV